MAHITVNFKSDALDMPVMFDVLIPQGRGGYKQLYLLHGAGGDRESWLLKSRVADYVENKNIAVIMPAGNNMCYVDNVYDRCYFSFITEELVDKMQQWFSLSSSASDRYIAGMSMGGYGAVYAALKNKNMYNAAFSYSGLLDILERYDNPQGIDMYPVFGKRENLQDDTFNINNIVLKNNEIVDNRTKFFITCGENDKRIHMSRKFYENAKKNNYNIAYVTQPGEHDWDYWDVCIKNTINIIDGEKVSSEWSEAWQSLI